MYICTYVYMYICIYVYMYICMHVYVYCRTGSRPLGYSFPPPNCQWGPPDPKPNWPTATQEKLLPFLAALTLFEASRGLPKPSCWNPWASMPMHGDAIHLDPWTYNSLWCDSKIIRLMQDIGHKKHTPKNYVFIFLVIFLSFWSWTGACIWIVECKES